MNPCESVKRLYYEFGQRKPMGINALDSKTPHYFLHRKFLGENDLLIILNTLRCAYSCKFCQLPIKSSKEQIHPSDILMQFLSVLNELKHSLSVIERVTLSNNGSILDSRTLPIDTLFTIAKCVHELRCVRVLVLETRLEFADPKILRRIQDLVPGVKLNILTGFETLDAEIRDKVLCKRETLALFENGLDIVAECNLDLTAYILYKPSQIMSDDDAYLEASRSIDYLYEQCDRRNIKLFIRINPMYAAEGSLWAKTAQKTPTYRPPKLTDIMKLAENKNKLGIPIYIGLSTEGLDNGENYSVREDYSRELIKQIKLFNDKKIMEFCWRT